MARETLSVEELARIVKSRRDADPETSYTARLFARGIDQCAKKFGEEAVETVIASLSGDKQAICAETADVLYHLVVLLEAAGVDLQDVYAELGRREGTSGIEEKAARRHT